jgi:hypothetical protein
LFILFELYYQLCKLRGYKARHFLDPLPEDVRSRQLGQPLLLIWPYLPFSIRLLDRVFPCGRIAHAKFVPYTAEAAASARASGHRFIVLDTVKGEFKAVRRL